MAGSQGAKLGTGGRGAAKEKVLACNGPVPARRGATGVRVEALPSRAPAAAIRQQGLAALRRQDRSFARPR